MLAVGKGEVDGYVTISSVVLEGIGKDYAAQIEKILAVATPERFNELQKLADKYIR